MENAVREETFNEIFQETKLIYLHLATKQFSFSLLSQIIISHECKINQE